VQAAALFIPPLASCVPHTVAKGPFLGTCACGFAAAACPHPCTETVPVPGLPTGPQGSLPPNSPPVVGAAWGTPFWHPIAHRDQDCRDEGPTGWKWWVSPPPQILQKDPKSSTSDVPPGPVALRFGERGNSRDSSAVPLHPWHRGTPLLVRSALQRSTTQFLSTRTNTSPGVQVPTTALPGISTPLTSPSHPR